MSAAPAPRPCGSCPYRCDTPPGVWSEEEYAKLPPYDIPETGMQPPKAFFCHQQDGRLCAGWVAVHDMRHNLGLRLALLSGAVTGEDVDACIDYTTDVPLFESGTEAAQHGLSEVERPGPRAVRTIEKLQKRRARSA